MLLSFSSQCIGQSKKSLYKALDEKNGFKNARFGMSSTQVLGFFKDMFFQDSYENGKYYVTRSDKMSIGKAAVKEVVYGFYKDRLFSIKVVLYFSNSDNAIPVLESAYGAGKYDTFEYGKNRVKIESVPYSIYWSGDRVQMHYQASMDGDHDSLLTIESLVEMEKKDADEERQTKEALLKAKKDL
jgi:hypothetical protein